MIFFSVESTARYTHPPGWSGSFVSTPLIHATGQHLGQDVTTLEGPVAYENGPGAYAVVQRVPQTPPWGPNGALNLVVHLRYGASLSPFWEWTAHPDSHGGTSHYITIIAPPPSPASAAEVGERIAGVLSGAINAWPTSQIPVV